MTTNWQQIEEGELKHSSVHHLMAIHDLRHNLGYARITDISKYLNITRGSVSITMNKLNDSGFIEFDENKHISLTTDGNTIVKQILQRRAVIKDFFKNNLLLSEDQATNCACKMEHVISDKIVNKLAAFTSFISKKQKENSFYQELKMTLDSKN
jgi:DtxR family Mn-dependent transcriptional regulator